MRVATSSLYSISRSGLQRLASEQAHLQEQLDTQRRILTPADDPIASARALDIHQNSAMTSQYTVNSKTADSALSLTESILKQVSDRIQDLQAKATEAGNPTQKGVDKKALDSDVQGLYQQLLGLANSSDSSGDAIFSGFQGVSKAFTETSFGNVVYNGDEGQRKVQISSGRQIPISEAGSDIFQRIKNGNGTFVTSAAATNGGSGVVSPGEVVDPNKWAAVAPQDFSVQFYWQANALDPTKPTITYDLVDNTTGNSLIDGTASAGRTTGPRTYTAGSDIQFKQLTGEVAVPAWDYGIKMSVSGTPVKLDTTTLQPVGAAGAADAFSVKASSNVDIFATLGIFSKALNNYNTDGAGAAQADFQNQLNTVQQNLSNALTKVLTIQSGIGSRMNETSSVQSTNEDLQLQYQTTLTDLEGLDNYKALSDFSMNQMLLDVTRKTFASVQGLSLFQYIN